VILPKRNEQDLEELPEDVLNEMTFVPVEWIDEALKVALVPDEPLPNEPKDVDETEFLRQPAVSLN
jgi:ATP-dependent Lon protease